MCGGGVVKCVGGTSVCVGQVRVGVTVHKITKSAIVATADKNLKKLKITS